MWRRASLLVVLLSEVAAGQRPDTTAIVRGVVAESGRGPVAEIEVYVASMGKRTRTDSSGRFVLTHLTGGPTQLVFRRPGWMQHDTVIAAIPSQSVELAVTMRRSVQTLGAVTIVSQDECPNKTLEGFECRRRAGIGVFRDSAQMAAQKPIFVGDFLYGVDGLRRVPALNNIRLEATRGWRCVRTLIDGRLPIRGDNNLTVDDYRAVEFYAEPRDVPEWYKNAAFAGGRPCSLIVYWTRFAPRVDPRLDQSESIHKTMQARRDSLRVADSLARRRPQ